MIVPFPIGRTRTVWPKDSGHTLWDDGSFVGLVQRYDESMFTVGNGDMSGLRIYLLRCMYLGLFVQNNRSDEYETILKRKLDAGIEMLHEMAAKTDDMLKRNVLESVAGEFCKLRENILGASTS